MTKSANRAKDRTMSEVTPDYKTEVIAKSAGVEWRRCPHCHMVYGFEENGGEYLRVGKLRVKYVQAVCGDCGHEIVRGNIDYVIMT